MYRTNCPSVKNGKRRIALFNNEGRIRTGQRNLYGDKSTLTESGKARIVAEIAVLKSRIVG